MSEFIREVDEEYRRDRVVGFLAKYQSALIVLVLAVVLGTAAYRVYLHYQTQAAEAANARYDAAMQLMREGKPAEAQAAFDKIQGEGVTGYAALARLKAVEILAVRDPAGAARGYDAISVDTGVEPTLRDAAQIRGAMLRVDSDDPKAFEARYAGLASEGFTFRASLRELLALAAFKRNDTEAAGRWLDQVVTDPNAPTALRRRAEAFLGLVAAGAAQAGTPEASKPVLDVSPSATPPAVAAQATPAQATPASTTPTPVTPAKPTIPPASAPPAR